MEFSHSLRTLIRNPVFTAPVVLMLAIGIGANATIFAVIDRLFIRPLPFNDQDRLVSIKNAWPLFQNSSGDGEIKGQPDDAFDGVAQFEVGRVTLGGEIPQVIRLAQTSRSYFSILGTGAQTGYVFSTAGTHSRGEKLAVLSYGLWRRTFNQDASVAGRQITLNGHSFTVIGVMPSDFLFLERGREVDAWVPLVPNDPLINSAQKEGSGTIARLKPGLTLEEAQARTDVLFERIRQSQPELHLNSQDRMLLSQLRDHWFGNLRSPLIMLLVAAMLLLLIACANTLGLMIARSVERQKEIAIKAALGAGWTQLVRQYLIESLLLGIAGGVLGLLIAYWAVEIMLAVSPTRIPHSDEVGINLKIIAFAFAISIPAAIIPGLISSWRISRTSARSLAQEISLHNVSSTPRLRKLLVVSEVALTVLILINAGLLLRSFQELLQEKLGFDPHNVLSLEIAPSETRYSDKQKRHALYQQITDRVRNLPGVAHVGTVNYLPIFSGSFIIPVKLQERVVPPELGFSWTYRVASSDYFNAMRIPIVAGRAFSEQDDADAPRVAILDQSAADFLAAQFFSNESVIGKHLILNSGKEPSSFEIVGIAGDIRQQGLDIATYPGFYLHAPQRPPSVANLVVRSTSDPASIFSAVRNSVSEVDKDLSVSGLRLMEEQVAESVSRRRFALLLTSILGFGALLLSMVGLYSLMSHMVSHRTHEIGVRMALGASVRDVAKLILRQALALVLAGAALGILASLVAGQLVASLLLGLTTTDPVTLASVTLILIVVSLVACYVPARRAMKIDPIDALRIE